MSEQHWLIRCFDGLQELSKHRLPASRYNENRMITLLQRLAARHLTDDEIFATALRRNNKWRSTLLEPKVSRDSARILISVGEHPYYVAEIEIQRGKQ